MLGEGQIIETYLRPLAEDPLAFNLLDDAACIDLPDGYSLVVTKDMLCAGTHFFPDDPADRIAQKALRTNISDLVAKGAQPYRYSMGLAFGEMPDAAFLHDFCSGLRDDQNQYGVSLLGGDLTKHNGGLVISITAYGLVKGRSVTRLGANVGDFIYITGTVGDAALGLLVQTEADRFTTLSEASRSQLINAYQLPRPPSKIANTVMSYASASMDVSDGLVGDLSRLCRASDVSATLDVAAVPLSTSVKDALNAESTLLRSVLTGGDDYQTLACVPPESAQQFEQEARANDISVTCIGTIDKKREIELTLINAPENISLSKGAYEHFS